MSENNQDRRRAARERLQRERELEKRREKRRRTLIVASAVVGVLGLAAVVGLIAANAGKDGGDGTDAGPVVAPAGAEGEEQLAIPVGAPDAPSTLTVWEDFRCPACAAFENTLRDTIHDMTEQGQLKVEYRLATIIDGNLGGNGSKRAANAAACAQDAGHFAAYHDVLFEDQPPETDDAYADNDKLIELAGKVEGLDTPAFRQCVQDGTYSAWVNESNQAFQDGGFRGTPTVLLNGESIFPQKGDEQISVENFKKWVAEANEGKQPGTEAPASPTRSPSPADTGSPAPTGS
ncbi:DsbA family protein [Streptomyces sp. MUM 178J]|uniref:DsbA family protein n=1 Tax=Streptomyces sp. MUM 178J TaxID=2791991 RepID=UPI001F038F8D|nr:thioredoxin domain-containing protein [Streptomyces sp. MUM 178J]WRQ78943.1 thioredoxin domain-containing protein [Streptomyces sp. MUM 178J]